MYQPDEELKSLAKLAIELGLDAVIASNPEWTAVEAALRKTGRRRRVAGGAGKGAGALVQRVHRHRLVPPRPQLERPDEHPALRHRHLHREAQTGRFDRATDREGARRARPHHRRVPRPDPEGRGPQTVRRVARLRQDRVPLRRKPPVLRRALVPFGVLEQDARSRRRS